MAHWQRELLVMLTVAAALVGLVLFFSWVSTESVDSWTQIDDSGDCYIHETKYNGVWPFNEDGQMKRETYCREAQ